MEVVVEISGTWTSLLMKKSQVLAQEMLTQSLSIPGDSCTAPLWF